MLYLGQRCEVHLENESHQAIFLGFPGENEAEVAFLKDKALVRAIVKLSTLHFVKALDKNSPTGERFDYGPLCTFAMRKGLIIKPPVGTVEYLKSL